MSLSQTVLHWFDDQPQTFLHHPFSFSFLLFLSLIFLLWINSLWVTKSSNLPPSPPKLPIIGHLHYLSTLPHRSFHALSQKYGPIMLLNLGCTPTLVVSSTEIVKKIIKIHEVIFSNRPMTTAVKVFLYGGKDLAFAPYGDYWKQARKMCVMDLLSANRVRSFRFIREEEASNMVNKIKQYSSSIGTNVNLSTMIVGATNSIISRAALSRNLEGERGGNQYADLANEVMDLFGVFCMKDVFPSLGWVDVLTGLDARMKRCSKEIHEFLDEVIEDHLVSRKPDDRKDLVDLVLHYHKDPTLGVELTRANLRTIILDMFVAGTNTMYTAVESTMAELMNHPIVMKKLQEEVRRVVGTKSTVGENDINQMSYLNCVVKEALRLHPPVILSGPRETTKSVELEGYNIPAKTRVLINLWTISRDPKIWDRPDEFMPERFMNNPIDYISKDFTLITFGGGRRICPGISFALTSVENILASLLYWFDWEMPSGAEKKDIDMTESFGLTVNLKYPLILVPVSHFS
ncbi:hypothetical protein IFM89_018737 [Coptis chinensis]|uniref:Cytochrome P450 n=1 Tax=Coptis chinensis TaxID=261450 RepID=A0A835HMX2_9MAGN|nr:hypothetical protein IFM89_018737 [Coptis chinensis]